MKPMHFLLIIITALLVGSAFLGCDDEESKPVQPTIELLEAPIGLPGEIDTFYQYRVRLYGTTADSIYCGVQESEGFALFDDGGTAVRHQNLTDSVSGDDWAGNNIFTARLNPMRVNGGINGFYTFAFWVPGQPDVLPREITVNIADVNPCEIGSYIVPESLPACLPFEAGCQVEWSDYDSVISAKVELLVADGELSVITSRTLDRIAANSWHSIVEPDFFRCVPPNAEGLFYIRYAIQTAFQMECSSPAVPITYIPQLATLSNSTLPDTAYRPATPGDSNLIVVTANMDDCELEGATDYNGLEFQVRRDPNDWDRVTGFYLRNDGVAPDAVAGDNTYSSWLVIKYDATLPNNMYYFRFYAIEGFPPCPAVWDSSEFLLDSIRIIQSGVNLSSLDPPGEDDLLGIQVWQEARP